jgi:hypothetical protein
LGVEVASEVVPDAVVVGVSEEPKEGVADTDGGVTQEVSVTTPAGPSAPLTRLWPIVV